MSNGNRKKKRLRRLFQVQNGLCCYCEKPVLLRRLGPNPKGNEATIEHRDSNQNKRSLANTLLACSDCNTYRAKFQNPLYPEDCIRVDHTPEEFKELLGKKFKIKGKVDISKVEQKYKELVTSESEEINRINERMASCPPMQAMPRPSRVHIGERFGRFLLLGRSKEKSQYFVCLCDCGDYQLRKAGALVNRPTSQMCHQCYRYFSLDRFFENYHDSPNTPSKTPPTPPPNHERGNAWKSPSRAPTTPPPPPPPPPQ